jgi:sortase (surface protein transpeptidase)
MRLVSDRDHCGHRPPVRRHAPWGLIVLILLVGLALMRTGAGAVNGPPQPGADAAAVRPGAAAASAPAAGTAPPGPEPLQPSKPDRVKIPMIKVDAPLMPLGLDAEGWIDSPPAEDKNLAGWYRDAVTPGEKGTAVIVGHVDNRSGPVVFYNLGALKKGHLIEVVREDRRTAVFEIYGIEVYDKRLFPAERVYGDTGSAELRVITCGGGYTRDNGYGGNVVVYAKMIKTRDTSPL